ncbi:acyl carrier protein [Stenotrophobium rhamnosiphilum]|uniref:Acyl carrier protein n=1 Tax=Stenotrophobium rhamnosiphilum TaxID=2029166 RepID=A0A2T5MDL2_9GAMM|nr:acyl carrier protein [Stenotrophobium rhamnosiphilum]PTU30664.1 acyl carrier protein [Stenotrophobium rhamnosiphilum]
MTIENFVEKFAFAIEVETVSLTADTEFKALPNWDSLNALSVIAMADADYGVALSGEDVHSSTTINDVWKIVSARKQ